MMSPYSAATTSSYTAGTRRNHEHPNNIRRVVDDQRGFSRGKRPLCGQWSIGKARERLYH
jgi:hypothetical protein